MRWKRSKSGLVLDKFHRIIQYLSLKSPSRATLQVTTSMLCRGNVVAYGIYHKFVILLFAQTLIEIETQKFQFYVVISQHFLSVFKSPLRQLIF